MKYSNLFQDQSISAFFTKKNMNFFTFKYRLNIGKKIIKYGKALKIWIFLIQ